MKDIRNAISEFATVFHGKFSLSNLNNIDLVTNKGLKGEENEAFPKSGSNTNLIQTQSLTLTQYQIFIFKPSPLTSSSLGEAEVGVPTLDILHTVVILYMQ